MELRIYFMYSVSYLLAFAIIPICKANYDAQLAMKMKEMDMGLEEDRMMGNRVRPIMLHLKTDNRLDRPPPDSKPRKKITLATNKIFRFPNFDVYTPRYLPVTAKRPRKGFSRATNIPTTSLRWTEKPRRIPTTSLRWTRKSKKIPATSPLPWRKKIKKPSRSPRNKVSPLVHKLMPTLYRTTKSLRTSYKILLPTGTYNIDNALVIPSEEDAESDDNKLSVPNEEDAEPNDNELTVPNEEDAEPDNDECSDLYEEDAERDDDEWSVPNEEDAESDEDECPAPNEEDTESDDDAQLPSGELDVDVSVESDESEPPAGTRVTRCTTSKPLPKLDPNYLPTSTEEFETNGTISSEVGEEEDFHETGKYRAPNVVEPPHYYIDDE